jgi:hypothetical protein
MIVVIDHTICLATNPESRRANLTPRLLLREFPAVKIVQIPNLNTGPPGLVLWRRILRIQPHRTPEVVLTALGRHLSRNNHNMATLSVVFVFQNTLLAKLWILTNAPHDMCIYAKLAVCTAATARRFSIPPLPYDCMHANRHVESLLLSLSIIVPNARRSYRQKDCSASTKYTALHNENPARLARL